VGAIQPVRLTRALPYDLLGEIVEAGEKVKRRKGLKTKAHNDPVTVERQGRERSASRLASFPLQTPNAIIDASHGFNTPLLLNGGMRSLSRPDFSLPSLDCSLTAWLLPNIDFPCEVS
jgi:hypothetical protein